MTLLKPIILPEDLVKADISLCLGYAASDYNLDYYNNLGVWSSPRPLNYFKILKTELDRHLGTGHQMITLCYAVNVSDEEQDIDSDNDEVFKKICFGSVSIPRVPPKTSNKSCEYYLKQAVKGVLQHIKVKRSELNA